METEQGSQNSALHELRSRLIKNGSSLDSRALQCDPFLLRYLRHNGESVERAEKMLNLYTDYMVEHGSDKPSNMTFPSEIIQDFPFQLGGFDYENRPVVMIPDTTSWNLKKYIERGQEQILLRYMMDMRLKGAEVCLERPGVDSGVVLVNVENFQYSQYFHRKSLLFLLDLLQLVEKIAPGECSRLILINAPKMLKVLFETVRKLVNVHVDIIIFGSGDKTWREKLRRHFPEDGISKEFGGTLENYWEPCSLLC